MSTATANAGSSAAGAMVKANAKFTPVRLTGGVRSICGCTLGCCRLCKAWTNSEIDARHRLEKKARLALEAKAKAAANAAPGEINFMDLYQDIVLQIGEHLDLETSIALFLAMPTHTPVHTLAHRKLSAIKTGGLRDLATENLLIFLGKLDEKDLRNLGPLISFADIIEKMESYNGFLSYYVLTDHTQQFNKSGQIKVSKNLEKKYGHIRQNKYLAGELHSAWLDLSMRSQARLNNYYYSIFNIRRFIATSCGRVFELKNRTTCYDDPLAQLGIICERIPMKKLVRLMDTIYASIYGFTRHNFTNNIDQKAAMKKYFSLIEAMDSIHAYILAKFKKIEKLDEYLLNDESIPMERVIGISIWNLPLAERQALVNIRWPHPHVGGIADENALLSVFAEYHYIAVRPDGFYML